MSKISIKANVVGMKYYDFTYDAEEFNGYPNVRLIRDPENAYDRNALRVEVMGKKAGHIDKANASILSPIIEKGAIYDIAIDESRAITPGSIPVFIVVESSSSKIRPPQLSQHKQAGIYKISINGHRQQYIGQSRDIQNRISKHWDELNRGIHTNPILRELWYTYGGAAFHAEIMECSPPGLSDLELSHWLLAQERHWISQHGGLKETLNRIEPELILNESAKKELAIAVREKKKRDKEERASDRARLEELKTLNQSAMGRRSDLHKRGVEISKSIAKITGIRGFLFATESQKALLPQLQAQSKEIDTQIIANNQEMAKVAEAENTLRRKLYPSRGKRHAPFR